MSVKISKVKFERATIGHEEKLPLIHDVSFEVKEGQSVWIHGPSGAGKSTLVRTMAALVMPLSGHYYINDMDVTEMTFEEFLPYRVRIGFGFDLGGLLNNKTVKENLILPLQYHGVCSYDEAVDRVRQLTQLFGIVKYENKRPSDIPGGMRKAVCVAKAFVIKPDLVILDEPLAGLNDDGTAALDLLVQNHLDNGKTLIFSSRPAQGPERWHTHKLDILENSEKCICQINEKENKAVSA